MGRSAAETQSALCELLERIYDTGKVETAEGEQRTAEPVGVPRAHALRLAELVRTEGLESTLETGLAYGLSALAVAGVHAARGSGSHIAIDPVANTYYEGIAVENLRRAGLSDRVRVMAEPSQAALPRLHAEGLLIDFAFIDGMHLFDYALIDFFYIDLMLTTGGFVAFHDTWMPAVRDVVEFVLANRGYKRSDRLDGGMAILRKQAPDRRPWNHYRPFAGVRRTARTAEEESKALYERLRDGAHAAAAREGGFRTHDLVLAGSPLRMRFAGGALEPALLAAFAHARTNEIDEIANRLEVLLWDSASTGATDPEIPWALGDVRARGDVRGFDSHKVSVFTEPASGAITVLHRERGEIVYWVVDVESVPWYERGAPLRGALHHWAADRAWHFVHAAAVGRDGVGVLLAGPTGSGKSTTALACLAAGFDYVGDDYVVLTDGERPRAHCLYSTAKLDASALERLPALETAVVDTRREREHKVVLDLARFRPEAVGGSLPIDAIVLPRIAARGGPPVIRRAGAGEALRALAPTTLLQLPGAAHVRMKAMASLVRSVPVFSLELGADVDGVPEAVTRICDEVRS
jgi:predicted O-methyltransferase YrrM